MPSEVLVHPIESAVEVLVQPCRVRVASAVSKTLAVDAGLVNITSVVTGSQPTCPSQASYPSSHLVSSGRERTTCVFGANAELTSVSSALRTEPVGSPPGWLAPPDENVTPMLTMAVAAAAKTTPLRNLLDGPREFRSTAPFAGVESAGTRRGYAASEVCNA